MRPARRPSPAWILPLAAILFAGWLGVRAWGDRGTTITVQFEQGHGLKVANAVRYRGISVGEVRAVRLVDKQSGVAATPMVEVELRLLEEASRVARGGSRFWIVRPQLGLNAVAGLETLIGPRYINVLPGEGPPQRRFIGLPDAPVVEVLEPVEPPPLPTTAV